MTTSSCAGRISVFLEGEKGPLLHKGERMEGEGGEGEKEKEEERGKEKEKVVPGGEGRGGRWLFVSHDPLDEEGELKREMGSWGRVLGVGDDGGGGGGGGGRERGRGEKINDARVGDEGDARWRSTKLDVRRTRFVRFQFEPMVSSIQIQPTLIFFPSNGRPRSSARQLNCKFIQKIHQNHHHHHHQHQMV